MEVQQQRGKDLQVGQKIKKAAYCTILFGILSNNRVYQLVAHIINSISNFDEQVVDTYGNPTFKAVLIHMIIFFVIIFVFIV